VKSIFSILLIILLTGLAGWRNLPAAKATSPVAKNIILLIGDGMGLGQISAGVYGMGNKTILEKFPVIGLQKTTASDNLITDSAAAATAIACGEKTYNNAIGESADGKPCKSILEEAEEKGLATGMVVTSSIVHATPAAFIAHVGTRNFYEDIAEDFLKTDIDLFIGGGKQFFDRRDKDERNLIKELEKKGFSIYDYFNHDLLKVKPSIHKNFGFFTADNQPLPASQGRDYLPYAAQLALNFLQQRSDKGFFVMIEGSQIDWSGHANQAFSLVDEMRDFDKTIAQALAFAQKDKQTLVIVTADHETGGLSINEGSTMNKMDIQFTTNGHTGTMVPVFAYGPGAELFRGIYDNTTIYTKMRTALGW
jgi:alkaline phosphatase